MKDRVTTPRDMGTMPDVTEGTKLGSSNQKNYTEVQEVCRRKFYKPSPTRVNISFLINQFEKTCRLMSLINHVLVVLPCPSRLWSHRNGCSSIGSSRRATCVEGFEVHIGNASLSYSCVTQTTVLPAKDDL